MEISVTQAVKDRYGAGAQEREAALCCPVDYDPEYLKVIPEEVIERDYGCGDPSSYVRPGETVLDLGSGGGKICFIASQVVGAEGRVIGVDMTDEMLDLANRNAPVVAERIGYSNIEFRRGRIQDLKTDLDRVNAYLSENPVRSVQDYQKLEQEITRLGKESPMIADDSIDVIVSNCVLNLVSDEEKLQLFEEMYRVLKPGGRIAISDIVSDEVSPPHLKNDQELWSGCVSGAFQEYEFIQLLEDVGFYGITIDKLDKEPWQVVEGIEYRSMNVLAWKGKEGPCIDKNQAVIYKGPWQSVEDDDGQVYLRGQRMAVCEKTFEILSKEPYAASIEPAPPHVAVEQGEERDCTRPSIRDPRETKAGAERVTTGADACCGGPESSCC
ncbi:MAG: methyltransferase domain-containing protein [Sphingomonadales bacterium]